MKPESLKTMEATRELYDIVTNAQDALQMTNAIHKAEQALQAARQPNQPGVQPVVEPELQHGPQMQNGNGRGQQNQPRQPQGIPAQH